MPESAESAENRILRSAHRRGVIHDPHDFVAAVRFVHEGLRGVGREIDIPRRARESETTRAGAWNDRYRPNERAVLMEHVQTVVAAIASVDEPVLAEHDAVRMPSSDERELSGSGAGAAHL